jgi:hypothetical protein
MGKSAPIVAFASSKLWMLLDCAVAWPRSQVVTRAQALHPPPAQHGGLATIQGRGTYWLLPQLQAFQVMQTNYAFGKSLHLVLLIHRGLTKPVQDSQIDHRQTGCKQRWPAMP